MHRSGTSTLARTVNLLGVYLGEEQDLGDANEDNPEGYWERPDITRLNGRILASLGSAWDATTPLPGDWMTSPAIPRYKDELRRLLLTKFAGQRLWGWKDPRTCLLLPLWQQVLGELKTQVLYIFVVRSPLDVAASLKRRDNMSVRKAVAIWLNYNLAAVQSVSGARVAFLSYDKLVENWEPELCRCFSILALDWPRDEVAVRKAISSFIRPSLRHSSIADKKPEALPSQAREVFALLLGACHLKTGLPLPPAFFERVSRITEAARIKGDCALDIDESAVSVARPSRIQRTWWRWKRSIKKRLRTLKTRPGRDVISSELTCPATTPNGE